MGAKLFNIAATVSTAILAAGCFLLAGAGDFGEWELSFPAVQLHAPAGNAGA